MATQSPFDSNHVPQPDTRLVEMRPRPQVSVSAAAPGAASFGVEDAYYIFFRHKWKILMCTLAGLAGAAALFYYVKPPYQSDAKLFVRYVIMEGKPVRPNTDDTITKSPDRSGETIM